jgi:outer membrane protein assembly factor BamB
VVGDRLFTMGSRSVLHCFDKKTGSVRWRRDLVRDFGAPVGQHVGHCPSPIAYGNTVIVTVDRPRPDEHDGPPDNRTEKVETTGHIDGQTLVAFDQATGKLVWQGLDFPAGFSSPILIKFDGQDQLVFLTPDGLIGVDPRNGDLLWHHPVIGSAATVVWDGKDVLFYTSRGPSRFGVAVRLASQDGKTVARELWTSRKVRIDQPTPVRIGDHFYGATDRILLCVDFETGKRAWAKRNFPMASCIYGDGKLIALDEDGWLTLATATPEDLTVHSKCKITERYSFSVPTLVGDTLYVRDRKHIMALDLGT